MENHSLVARKTICYFRCCCLFMISFCDLLYSGIRDCALLRSAQLCAGSNLMSPTVVLELKRHQLVQARGVVYLAKYFNCESESLSDVQLFGTPWTIQSMEFSRPEYWSGWPFSSPEDLPNPGIEPRSHVMQVDSLPAEPQGKAKNIGVGSLSILQQIFPTQESNQDLLHCRQILH